MTVFGPQLVIAETLEHEFCDSGGLFQSLLSDVFILRGGHEQEMVVYQGSDRSFPYPVTTKEPANSAASLLLSSL